MLKNIRAGLEYCQNLALTMFIGLLARIGLAATFWLSGQSKVEGLQIDILGDTPNQWGIPTVTSSAVSLFREEYRLPLLSPELAAILAAGAEHLLPVLLILGLGTRFSAFMLLVMTLVIQIFVYPDAWPVHATWMAALLYLMARGAGKLSVDYLLLGVLRRNPRSSH